MDDRSNPGGRRPRAVVLLPDVDDERVATDARLPTLGLALDVSVAGVVLLLGLVGSFVFVWATVFVLVIWMIPTLATWLMRRRLRSHGLARLADVRLDRATWVAAGASVVAALLALLKPVGGPWLGAGRRSGDLTGLIIRVLVVAGIVATVTWVVSFGLVAHRALHRRLIEVLAWQRVLDGEVLAAAPADPGDSVASSAADGSVAWAVGSAVPLSLAYVITEPGPTLRDGRRPLSSTRSLSLIVTAGVAVLGVLPAAGFVGLFFVVPWLVSR